MRRQLMRRQLMRRQGQTTTVAIPVRSQDCISSSLRAMKWLVVAVAASVILSGCHSKSDDADSQVSTADLQSYRSQFVLSTEPTGDIYTPTDVMVWASDDEISDPPGELPDTLAVTTVESEDLDLETEADSSDSETSADEIDLHVADLTEAHGNDEDKSVGEGSAEETSDRGIAGTGEEFEFSEILLAGRIDAGDNDPFQAGEASFLISQLPDEGHAADDPDHADNCPFCKRELAKAPKALIRFAGSDGKTLLVQADELFGIKKGDIVVIRGTAVYDKSVHTVMVEASGIFRRP